MRDPAHVLAATDVAFVPPSPTWLTDPDHSDPGQTGQFIAWLQDMGYIGVGDAPTSIGHGSAVGSIIAHYLDQLTPQDAEAYLSGYVKPALAKTLQTFVGTPIAQLPTTVNVPIIAPLPATGLADPAADAIRLLGAAVQDLIPNLLGGLAPLLIGVIVLVAILALIYLGVRRTLL